MRGAQRRKNTRWQTLDTPPKNGGVQREYMQSRVDEHVRTSRSESGLQGAAAKHINIMGQERDRTLEANRHRELREGSETFGTLSEHLLWLDVLVFSLFARVQIMIQPKVTFHCKIWFRSG